MYPEARFMMNPVLGRVKGRFLLTRFGGKVMQILQIPSLVKFVEVFQLFPEWNWYGFHFVARF